MQFHHYLLFLALSIMPGDRIQSFGTLLLKYVGSDMIFCRDSDSQTGGIKIS
jgi:hypothetical protein